MTYIRRLVRVDNVYLYEVTSYRDKEIIKDNIATVRKPKNRIDLRPLILDTQYDYCRFKFNRKTVDLIQAMVSFLNNTFNVILDSYRTVGSVVESILKDAIYTNVNAAQRQKGQYNYRMIIIISH
ncbi:MAG: hypothetical protein M1327_06020 [Candidatus Thermoplasmatota archaeon]|nr:hypothetical protein [Candidatus Thermoplasmatota archaeon]